MKNIQNGQLFSSSKSTFIHFLIHSKKNYSIARKNIHAKNTFIQNNNQIIQSMKILIFRKSQHRPPLGGRDMTYKQDWAFEKINAFIFASWPSNYGGRGHHLQFWFLYRNVS